MKNKLKSLHANATNCNAADEKLLMYISLKCPQFGYLQQKKYNQNMYHNA